MVVQYGPYDFSSYTPLVVTNDTTLQWIADNDPAASTDNPPTTDPNETATIEFGDFNGIQFKETDYDIYFRIRKTGNSGNGHNSGTYDCYMGVKLTFEDNTYLKLRYHENGAGGFTLRLDDNGTELTQVVSTDTAKAPFQSKWCWFKLSGVVSGSDRNWKAYYDRDSEASTRSGASFTLVSSLNTTQSGDKSRYVTKLEFIRETGSAHVNRGWQMDDIEVYTNDAAYVDNPIASLGGKNPLSVDWLVGLGEVGRAIIRASDRGIADADATTGLRSNLNKLLTVVDNYYGKTWFAGEIKTLEMARNSFTYIAPLLTQKLLKLPTGYTNTVEKYEMYYARSRTIRDYREITPTDSSWNGLFVAFEKVISHAIKAFPTNLDEYAVTDYDAPTLGALTAPGYENGSVNNCYYKKTSQTLYDQSYYMHGVGDSPRFLVVDFDFWMVTNTNLSEIVLEVQFATKPLKTLNYRKYPRIWMYDYTDNVYRHAVTVRKKNGFSKAKLGTFPSPGSGNNRSVTHTYSIRLEDVSSNAVETDYLTTSGGGVSSNFTEYRFRMLIYTGEDNSVEGADFMLFYANINAIADTEQAPEEGAGTINSSTTTTALCDIADANSWQTKEMPDEDGFTQGDNYIICQDIETVLDAAWAAHAMSGDITLDIEDNFGVNIPLTRDVRYESFLPLIQELCKKNNGIWYYEYDATATPSHIIKVIDSANVVSTGVTLTEKDFINYNEEDFTLRVIIEEQVTFVRVVGDNGVTYITSNLGEEYESGFGDGTGDETKVLFDPDVKYTKQAQELADSYGKVFSEAEIYIQGKLDFSTGKNAYNQLQVGKSVVVQLQDLNDDPDGDPKVYSLVDATLTIIQMQGMRNLETAFDDEVIITLQRRNT